MLSNLDKIEKRTTLLIPLYISNSMTGTLEVPPSRTQTLYTPARFHLEPQYLSNQIFNQHSTIIAGKIKSDGSHCNY